MKVVRQQCGRCDYVWDVPQPKAPAPARGRCHRVQPDEFSSRTKPECTDRLLNVQHVPGGYYPFAVNPPTSRVCGSLSWELRSRRERSISFFAGDVEQRRGTTSRSAQ